MGNSAPRVEAVIADVMSRHPGVGKPAQAKYYEEVHQHLAPLARELERELSVEKKKVDDLAALVRRLAQSLRKAAPDNDLPEKALDYLKRSSIPAHVLREVEQDV